MIDAGSVPVTALSWDSGVRIIRDTYPPIDVFEDIADPEDWPLLMAAEQKTNPRLMDSIGNLDLIPPDRRVGGEGASILMAPFTHTSPDRPSRFSDGRLGVLYVASDFETAVHETLHHHGHFMAATDQAPGWTSQFCEVVLKVDADLLDLRGLDRSDLLHVEDYRAAQAFGASARAAGHQGVAYPSVRGDGDCVGLFYPDLASAPQKRRHLEYHWDGSTVDLVKDVTNGDVFRVL
ncbi:MAG: RES family NAD+ phosphorylase [Pseudomonadota bacterium]